MNDRLKMQVKDMGPDDVEDMFNDLREKGGGYGQILASAIGGYERGLDLASKYGCSMDGSEVLCLKLGVMSAVEMARAVQNESNAKVFEEADQYWHGLQMPEVDGDVHVADQLYGDNERGRELRSLHERLQVAGGIGQMVSIVLSGYERIITMIDREIGIRGTDVEMVADVGVCDAVYHARGKVDEAVLSDVYEVVRNRRDSRDQM